jgi:hypothetical protein
MEPVTPSFFNRTAAFSLGFIAGVIGQVLFRKAFFALIGPATAFFSSRTVGLIAILLLPPLLSLLFVRTDPDSVQEDFLRGFQLGSLTWFIVAVVSTLP